MDRDSVTRRPAQEPSGTVERRRQAARRSGSARRAVDDAAPAVGPAAPVMARAPEHGGSSFVSRPSDVGTGGRIQRSALLAPHRSMASGSPATGGKIRRSTAPDGGLPPRLRAGVESLSGVALDDVRVHYDSPRPARLGALAYTQGTDIFVGPGQEEHLPHEAWHVVQQATGRVGSTTRLMQMPVNDDAGLEREADVMGARAMAAVPGREATRVVAPGTRRPVAQMKALKVEGFAKHYGTLSAFKSAKADYKKLTDKLAERLPDIKSADLFRKTDFFLNQMFSAEEDCAFESLEHLAHSMAYDIKTKSEDKNHTLQEQYFTRYGWKERERQVAAAAKEKPTGKAVKGAKQSPVRGKAPTTAARGKHEPKAEKVTEQLRVYRTMELKDYLQIKEVFDAEGQVKEKDFSGLSGHLGDYKEALKYLYSKSPETKVLVEFTLGVGKERQLFGSSLAFQESDQKLPTLERMKYVLSGGDKEASFAPASKAEGLADDKVGIKSESHGDAGFSLSIGGGSSPNVFMNTIESMKAIGIRSTGRAREDHDGLDDEELKDLAGENV